MGLLEVNHNMKKFKMISFVVIMLIVSMQLNILYGNAKLVDQTIETFDINEKTNVKYTVINDNKIKNSTVLNGYEDEFGVWIYTNYDGSSDKTKRVSISSRSSS